MQAVGEGEGVEKRIDVVATALQVLNTEACYFTYLCVCVYIVAHQRGSGTLCCNPPHRP